MEDPQGEGGRRVAARQDAPILGLQLAWRYRGETTRGLGMRRGWAGVERTVTHWLNSDVLPTELIATAVIVVPGGT